MVSNNYIKYIIKREQFLKDGLPILSKNVSPYAVLLHTIEDCFCILSRISWAMM